MAEVVDKTLWIRGLVGDLWLVHEHVDVYCDSQSAIQIAKNRVHHGRTKHIDVRFHFIQEIIERGEIFLKKISIMDNQADMLIKVVSFAKFKHYLTLVNILRC